MMRSKCPNCQAAYSIKPEFIGKQTVCQNCGQIFTIFEDRPQLPQTMAKPPKAPFEDIPPDPDLPADPPEDPVSPPSEPPYFPPPESYEPPSPPPAAPKPTPTSVDPGRTIAARPPREPVDYKKALAKEAAPAKAKSGGKLWVILLILILGAGGYYFYHEREKANQAAIAALKAQLARVTNPLLKELRAERQKIADQLAQETEDIQKYAPGVPMYILKSTIIAESRLAQTLLTQEIASIESGAQPAVRANKTNPDPQLAQSLEQELNKLTDYIAQRTATAPTAKGEAATALESELGTLHLIKAIVIRNYLTAKYGLNTFINNPAAKSLPIELSTQPPSGGAAPGANATAPAPAAVAPAAPQKILTVADILGSNSEWKVEGPWATRLAGTGSGLSVRILRLAAVNHAEINGVPQQASLFVSCQGNKTEMYVTFALPLAVNSNKVDMEYQIDNGEVVKEVWNASVDAKGAFSPKAIPTLRKMVNGQRIIFRVGYQNRENVIETFFELDGLAAALKPIQSACSWK